MYFVCFLTALLACIIGKICGMGGGVIIKPVLDALGVMNVSSINFLSSCTVAGMACWSVGKSVASGNTEINWKLSTPLAVGAAIGGILGKGLFEVVAGCFQSADMAGGVQALILFIAVLSTLIYTIFKDRIRTHQIENRILCLLIGVILGTLGSFLGIGGGPFNMAVLYYFFSMPTKPAAQNSLYVILVSQAAGLLKTILSAHIPQVNIYLLIGMIVCGVVGSEIGRQVNKKLSEKNATLLCEYSMVLVLCINCRCSPLMHSYIVSPPCQRHTISLSPTS